MSESVPTVDDGALYCPECGYDIRHTSEPRCPECGKGFDRATLAVSRLPWVHRRELGRVKAWWRTVGLVLWRPGDLGRQVALPVDWKDASRFRWVTIGVATAMVAAATGGLYPWMEVSGFSVYLDFQDAAAWWFPWAALLTGPGLILVVVSGFFAGARAKVPG